MNVFLNNEKRKCNKIKKKETLNIFIYYLTEKRANSK